ncbi:hypothetical protein MFLO_06549 [Listeria floridensis FSL S10-1187]|uniref:Uncharacterized protein n=1 Tax=Listeria floridensis FSL S10-1187 TaxID=1265817 RepID=A0ABN0RG04_9LIST|nr:DUF6056 family protein [Listeria floridensis]EUJ32745.1 hypothetical protein MFLO_06549 [Listeria floridensis FSL S10-1187]
MMNKFNRIQITLFSMAILFFFLVLSYMTPLTHDDWTWGIHFGTDRLAEWFKDYNGRYMGNLTEILITRSNLARYLLMGVLGAALVVLPLFIAKTSRLALGFLSFFLILSVPLGMFKSTFAWTAGFANYNTAIFFILLYLLIVKNVFNQETPRYNTLAIWIALPLGFISQLFVEHATIYNVFAALFIIVYSFVKFRKYYVFQLLYFLGTIMGAVMMFTNSAYVKIFSGADNYRSVETDQGLLSQIYEVFYKDMYKLFIMNNMWLNIVLALVTILLLVKAGKNATTGLVIIKNSLVTILTIYALYVPIVKNTLHFNFFTDTFKNANFEAWLSVLFYLAILLSVLFFAASKIKVELLFYLLSAAFVSAPLFLITPIGSRCFVIPYLFFVLYIIRLLVYACESDWIQLSNWLVPLAAIAIVTSVAYGVIFYQIKTADDARMTYVSEQVSSDAKIIVLKRLPHEEFLWNSTPISGSLQEKTFKSYYKIPQKTKIIIQK